jgi:glycosyltransferase involved in cell wall biosynthesis
MKKILFLVTQSEMGGAQRYLFEIARGLDRTKYEILAAAGEGDGELFGKLKSIGVKSFQLKQMKRTPWPWQISQSVWEIRDLLKKEKPDVLFLCSTTAGVLGSLAAKLARNRTLVIYRIGGWAFLDPRAFWKNWLILIAEKLTAPLKDLVIVNSELGRSAALKYHIVPENKLVKIYNGIDAGSLTFLSRDEAQIKLGLERFKNGKVIGTVANFYKTKGLEYFIEASRKIAETASHPNINFVIIGEGRLRPKLEGLIKKYRLKDKIMLTGRIPNAYQYLKAFDVFVLPSLKEGFPWIILEAQAAGLPIVATKVGALPEIIGEEFLVNPGDANALAEKINRALEHPVKPELKQDFTARKNARADRTIIADPLTAVKAAAAASEG